MKELFCVVGKQPLQGFSKTRLEDELGPDVAQSFYDAFIKDFVQRLRANYKGDVLFSITPDTEDSKNYFLSQGLKEEEISFQKELPFFERLKCIGEEQENTFIHLTGTDIPKFPYDYLKEVVDLNSIYIGPDEDGGFYYFGAPSLDFNLLNLDQSDLEGHSVFESLLKKCQASGKRVKVLKRWSDIDTTEDLKKALSKFYVEDIPNTYEIAKKFNLLR